MYPEPMQRTAGSQATSYDAGLRAFFQRVYNIMAIGLVVTGAVAYGVAHSDLARVIYSNPAISLVVSLAPLGFIFFGFTPNRIMRMTPGQLNGLFYAFSALLGLSMSYVFLVYSGQSIARVFFITAAMFAGMSIFGYTTRRDLSGMGSLMMMGAWGIFIAMIVNLFMQSEAVMFAVSVIGVVVYTGLVGWETQALKQTYAVGNGHEANAKMATVGALSLYMNFIMLFQFLLRLMGNRE